MNKPGAHPIVNPHFRLQWEDTQQAWVLLYPEGLVKLNSSAGEIMRRCNGRRSVDEIVSDLEQVFETRGLVDEVTGFLRMATEQRWVQLA